ncbi:MAG TPA: hypothetical protein VNA31_05530 [bacterium]|nr:hypothetical protein [bacterium]
MRGRVGYILTVAAAILVSSVVVSAQTSSSPSPSPTPTSTTRRAPFAIEAKILRISRSWAQVEVLKVTQGAGLKTHGKLWVRHSSQTKILKAGKYGSVRDLRIGKTVAIIGTASGRGRALTYQAASVTIVR